jgi:hypothetical protein
VTSSSDFRRPTNLGPGLEALRAKWGWIVVGVHVRRISDVRLRLVAVAHRGVLRQSARSYAASPNCRTSRFTPISGLKSASLTCPSSATGDVGAVQPRKSASTLSSMLREQRYGHLYLIGARSYQFTIASLPSSGSLQNTLRACLKRLLHSHWLHDSQGQGQLIW